jgi:hypothetical protein
VKQVAWIVFKIEFAVEQKHKAFARGQEKLSTSEGIEDFFFGSVDTTDEELDAFGTSGLQVHMKIDFKRFKDKLPTYEDVVEMRTSYEIAPHELIKINEICNSATNKNWQSKKALSYKVLDYKTLGKLESEIYAEYDIPLDDDEFQEWLNTPSPDDYKVGDRLPRPNEVNNKANK